jgi:hypothetical protein
MASKFNNKILVIVLAVLVGLFFLLRIVYEKRSSGNLKSDLVDIDSSLVNTILLYPSAEKGAEIIFTRTGDKWTVSKGEITADADEHSVPNMLGELIALKPERMVTRNKDKWRDFGVTDSLGTRVIIKEGKKEVLDLIVGRFEYQPGPGGSRGYGNQYGTGLTYVRLKNETDVYVVKGFLAMSFNQVFNRWRNQIFLRTDKNEINLLTFDYPADSGFVAMKSDSIWLIEGEIPDSAAMASYLNSLAQKSNTQFIDNFKSALGPDYQLTINGMNMAPIILKAYRRNATEFILNSSLNPDSYFISPEKGLFGTVFKSKSYFFTTSKK